MLGDIDSKAKILYTKSGVSGVMQINKFFIGGEQSFFNSGRK
jgi:hypothetical protein